MNQEALNFGRGDRVTRAFARVLRVVGDAVDAVGLVQAAGACDCAKSDLLAALNNRDHRHLRVEWLMAICDVAPPDFRARIVAALVEWQGLAVVPVKPLTAEEKLAKLEARLVAQLGDVGRRLVEEGGR
jgi:hypothetical protein